MPFCRCESVTRLFDPVEIQQRTTLNQDQGAWCDQAFCFYITKYLSCFLSSMMAIHYLQKNIVKTESGLPCITLLQGLEVWLVSLCPTDLKPLKHLVENSTTVIPCSGVSSWQRNSATVGCPSLTILIFVNSTSVLVLMMQFVKHIKNNDISCRLEFNSFFEIWIFTSLLKRKQKSYRAVSYLRHFYALRSEF